MDAEAQLEAGDFVAVACYFALVLCVGFYATCRSKRGTTEGYFLAGKNINWALIGASLLASNVGAPTFIALAGGAAASGIAVTIYEWHAVFMLLLLGWLFVPVYTASGCFTMPEYLKKRYGGNRLRMYFALLSLVMYILIKISAELYAGALFIQVILKWNLYFSIVLIMSITALYTITGGLTAVIYTDTLQAIIVIISATAVTIIGLAKVGGWQELKQKYMFAATNYTESDFKEFGNHTCGMPRTDSFHIFRDPVSSDLPWTGAVFGLTPIAMFVWCTDQLMVQRTLAAKNISHAKGGALFAAYLKILPFFLFVIPGLVSRVLYPEEVACASPEKCMHFCQNKDGCSNIAYPLLVMRLLPPGVRGIMLAALLAALMSSLTSIFNSASSMFTLDIYRRLRRHAKDTELLIVGRLFIVVLVGASIAWIPVLERTEGGLLWNYIQSISANIIPPWCVVFVLGVLWRRATEQGAFWGLMVGLLVGAIRLILEFFYKAQEPPCGSLDQYTTPAIIAKVHFLHFAIILTVICTVVTVVVSLFTAQRPPEKLHRRTWWTRHDVLEVEDSDLEQLSDYEPCDQEEVEFEEQHTRAVNADLFSKELEEVPLVEVHQPPVKRLGLFLLKWLCGYEPGVKRLRLTQHEKDEMRRRLISIEEPVLLKWILNINAIICIIVTSVLLGIFG